MGRFWHRVLGILVAVSVAAACAGSGESEVPGDDASGEPTPVASASPAPTTAATPVGESAQGPPWDDTGEPAGFDIHALLAEDPLVIFNAYPPKPDHVTYPLPPGQRDFDELWEPGAPWQTALEHVDIYRLHAFQLRHFMDDEQVITLVQFLREHEIPLMFETEPLIPPDPEVCAHTESYEAPWDLEMAVRLKALGGHVDVVAIEEPYHFGHLLDTPEACQYPVERVVDEVLQHVANLRELFGDIPVGTIEPIWSSPRTEPRDMEIWLDTFEEIAGEPFAFLHVDPDWYRSDWAEVAVGIEAVADARGVPFGVLYNGGLETDGLSWMNFMMANAAELETIHGATPQHVSFQSWVDWPDHALPETDLTALTSSITRYFSQRIQLSLERTDHGLTASVTDLDGRPVEGVDLDVTRISDGESSAVQTVRGVVPQDATDAVVLVRANAEDASVGAVAATLIEVSFSHQGGPNLVPNGDFDAGIDQWGIYGSHPDGVSVAGAGDGVGLVLDARADQDIFIDGATFPVESGGDYEVTVTYELGGGDPDSVVVSVAFVGLGRVNVFLRPLPEDLGGFTTGNDGQVQIPVDVVGSDPGRIVVSTAGDLTRWPATASVQLN